MKRGILSYTPGQSMLHRANPLTKLLLAFLICIACFVSDSLLFLVAILMIDLLLGAIGGQFLRAAKLLKGLLSISVFLFLLQILFVRSGNPVLTMGSFYITEDGLLTATFVVLRLVGATLPLTLLLSMTSMNDLSNALVEKLHMPYRYAFTFTTAIRFIPLFTEEMSGIMEAQCARGVEFDTRNVFKRMKLILPLCVPLLISSVKKTDASAVSAEIRGFYLRNRGSAVKRYPFAAMDGMLLLFAVALPTVAVMGKVL